jgi:hypothetical protein
VTWPPPPIPASHREGEPLTRAAMLLQVASDVRMAVLATPVAGGGYIELGTPTSGLRLQALDRNAARRLHEATGLLLTEIDKQLRAAGGHQHLTAVPDA